MFPSQVKLITKAFRLLHNKRVLFVTPTPGGALSWKFVESVFWIPDWEKKS